MLNLRFRKLAAIDNEGDSILGHSSAGFTLIEMAVALSVLSVVVALAGSGIFQIISFERFWREDLVATGELRGAGSRFAGDALNAEDAKDSLGVRVGCPPSESSSSVSLSWSDTADGSHSASYRISEGSLVRNYDGKENELARRVVANSLQVSLCQRLLTLDMQVQAGRGAVEDIHLETYMRKLVLQ